MWRKSIAPLMAVAALLAASNLASADLYTATAVYQAQTTFTSAPIQPISELSGSSGRMYTNVFANASTPGSEIRSVGAILFSTAQFGANGTSQTGLAYPGSPPKEIVAVFGLKGTLTNTPNTAIFTKGGAAVYAIPGGSFSPANPSTWTSNNTASVLATYSLKPQENVLSGQLVGISEAEQQTFAKEQTNIQAVTTAIQQLTSGVYIMKEASPSNFSNILPQDWALLQALFPDSLLDESIAIRISQSINFSQNFGPTAGPLEDPTQQGYINSYANTFLGLPFAAFGSGTFSDYLVKTDAANFLNGNTGPDFWASFNGVNINPSIQVTPLETVIPEPSSVLLLVMATGGAAFYTIRKRRNCTA